MKNLKHKRPANAGLKKDNILKTITVVLLLAVIFFSGSCNNNIASSVRSTGKAAYNMEQQIFTLCMLSNVSGGFNGRGGDTILSSTISAVDTILADTGFRSLAGNWKCVWGPAVMKHKSYNKAINTMFIAQSLDSPSVFVIAIAGTNFESLDDWVAEDFNVGFFKYWDSIVANIYDTTLVGKLQNPLYPFVSRATYRGLYNLACLKDSTTQTTALTFLKNVADTAKSNITIWTTGHSLGGALSPTLALYLNDTKATWCPNNSNNFSINCLAVAGATPGNLAFSRRYYQELGNNTIRVWNHNDPVPHGFQQDGDLLSLWGGTNMFTQIDTIFQPDSISTPFFLDSIVNAMAKLTSLYGYTQLYPGRDTEFVSAWYGVNDTIAGVKPLASPNSFLGQIVCQHVASYPQFFGVSAVQNRMAQVLGHNSPFFSGGVAGQPILSKSAIKVPALMTSKLFPGQKK